MWISFLIPKIEDGNNFGVSIQEDMLAEIRSVESEAAAFFDQISRYFITRGKIVTKVFISSIQIIQHCAIYFSLRLLNTLSWKTSG